MSNTETNPSWSRLLRTARALIRQVNSSGPVITGWTLGGGTALMLRIDHRESRDIDIFLSDPQQLAFLDPATHDFDFETSPSGHIGDGSKFLKLGFRGVGEIDFIVASELTAQASSQELVENDSIALETAPEIIAKKIYYRGSSIKPRDVFDIAAAADVDAKAIVRSLQQFKPAVEEALVALDRLNPDFVNRAISELAIRPSYRPTAGSARERARDLLREVLS